MPRNASTLSTARKRAACARWRTAGSGGRVGGGGGAGAGPPGLPGRDRVPQGGAGLGGPGGGPGPFHGGAPGPSPGGAPGADLVGAAGPDPVGAAGPAPGSFSDGGTGPPHGPGAGGGKAPGAGARPRPSGCSGKCSRGSWGGFSDGCSGKLCGGRGLWSAGRARSSLAIMSACLTQPPYFITSGNRPSWSPCRAGWRTGAWHGVLVDRPPSAPPSRPSPEARSNRINGTSVLLEPHQRHIDAVGRVRLVPGP